MKRFCVVFSLFVFIALVMSGSKVYAKDAVLNGVEISKSAQSGYNIYIDSDGAVKYSTQIPANNKILINLKNTKIQNNVTASYKNVSGVEHVIVKPVFGGVQIEISAQNAKNSNLSFSGVSIPYKKTNWAYGVLLFVGAVLLLKRHKKNKFSVNISPEENDILKSAFNSRDGLIARGLGARVIPSQPMVQNVRKVKFLSDYEVKELNLR